MKSNAFKIGSKVTILNDDYYVGRTFEILKMELHNSAHGPRWWYLLTEIGEWPEDCLNLAVDYYKRKNLEDFYDESYFC